MLERRPGENDLSFHKRLVFGKLVDKTLSDVDYSELAPLVYGKDYSSDVARRMLYGSRYTLELLDKERESSCVQGGLIEELELKRIEYQKERQRVSDQRTAYNKLIRERARQEELNDILAEAIRSGNLPELDFSPSEVQPSDNDLLVSLNDIHYGATVDNYWCKYDSQICAQMMSEYLDKIISIANTHHSENCIVWANGDLISGNIHHQIAVTNKENLIQQITGVSELIAEFLAELSKHFAIVKFVSVSGNHSRMDQKDRALMPERLDDLVEWYLKARMAAFENVEIGCNRIDATMYVMELRGLNYVGIHGDYDPTPSHIQTLQMMVGKPVHAVLLAHKHHNALGVVQGVRTVMGGSFLGMDDFCVSRRIIGIPEQMVCVCDETGIRCSYNIVLS